MVVSSRSRTESRADCVILRRYQNVRVVKKRVKTAGDSQIGERRGLLIPEPLKEESALIESRGWLDGDWYFEEDYAAVRLGFRCREKLHEEQSPYQKITLYDSAFLGRFLTLDDIIMLTERDEFVYHEMLAHVPLCSIPEPKNVLIVGGGDCGCLREVLRHPSVEMVVQCEIDERVTRVCEEYFTWVHEAVADPRVELVFDDGVKLIEGREKTFDLVIVDNTDPKGPSVNLFLRDFYARAARALKPGGVLVAQTESPHWDADLVVAVYGELRAVFAQVDAYLGWVPSYPSGAWSWAYAANDRCHDDYFDDRRARLLEAECRYYNSAVHAGAFALPNFVRQTVGGVNPFERFDRQAQDDTAS